MTQPNTPEALDALMRRVSETDALTRMFQAQERVIADCTELFINGTISAVALSHHRGELEGMRRALIVLGISDQRSKPVRRLRGTTPKPARDR